VLELDFDAGGVNLVLAGVTDGTALLAALGGTLDVTATTNAGYIVAYDNGSAYVYAVTEGVDAGVAVAAADIALIGVLNSVAVGTINNTINNLVFGA